MKSKNSFVYIRYFLVFLVVLFCTAVFSSAQDTASNQTIANEEAAAPGIIKVATDITGAVVPASEEAKQIDKRASDVEEVIKKKEEKLEQAKTEAQKAIDEKMLLEKEVQLKEEAAIVAKQQLEVAQEEAALGNKTESTRNLKDLKSEAAKLEKEASVAKNKLTKVASVAEVAQAELDQSQAKIEELKKSLESLKKERASKRTWFEKAVMTSILIAIGLILFLILRIIVRKVEDLVTEKGKIRESEAVLRVKTLSHLFHWIGTIVIILAITYMVLQIFGFDVAPLLAGAGIIGLAFGFGGQYLIRDVINGFFILIEGQFNINDVVKIGDLAGLVENVNLRTTTLRDLEGRVIIIPNGEIKTVINFTKEFSYALFDIGVAYKENVDRVIEVIKELGKEMRKDQHFGRFILNDLEMFGVDDFGDSQVTIRFRIKTLPIKQWEVAREFRRRIKNRFDELGIEIPFPHRTLYFGTGSDNDWLRKISERKSQGL